MFTVGTIKRGINKGFITTWELAKIVVPIYVIVTFLSYTPLLHKLAELCQPVMTHLGLPGEASLALVMGYTLNIYAALGVITTLALNTKEITIIAMMLLLCHSLPMETAVAKRTGVNATLVIAIRIVLSIGSGFLINKVL